jgi:hypothetical protein
MKASLVIKWLEAARRVTGSDPDVKISTDDENLLDITDVQINTANFVEEGKFDTVMLLTEEV